MFKKEDWIFGLISIAVGALTIYLTRDLTSIKSMDPAGPAALPTIVSWLMIAIGAVHVAGAVMKKGPAESESAKKGKKDNKKVVIICAACAIYYFLLEIAGYIIMTPLLIAAIMLGVGERGARRILTTSIFTTAFLFCVFYYALKVNMPLGVLDSLFN
ncbi:MAG: tripartite tricarboxylate transporter TctB family protein [Synergistaceae bacterium]|jgi:hypothetical protein|nr:tripartite tricarboxylate transporter TctB family protein [Synergistaceae bacterium]